MNIDLKHLNSDQRQAVEAVQGPVLIFAGAGSGKTRVLTTKIAYLINNKIQKPEEILAVTFTNKAAGEMRERVINALGPLPAFPTIGTFHSICARILRREITALGYSANFIIYDQEDQTALMKLVLEKLNISKDFLSPKSALSQVSLMKSKMISIDEALKKADRVVEKQIAKVYEVYQRTLKKNDGVDFDDLLIFPLEIFKKDEKVLEKYRKKWKYILVDEYQDTNRPQFEFIKMLSEKHGNISVVGDDDQSIYGWRGADIRNILDFEKVFKKVKTCTLTINYRSTQMILDAASAVVKNNIHRQEKTLKSANDVGDPLGLIETVDELEEADAVVSAIEKEIKIHKKTFRDFAILYRTNAQSRAFEDSLRRSGFPYNIVGGVSFYARKEIKDLMAYLNLVLNLKDTISLRRVINFPPRGIGLKTIDKCVEKTVETGKEFFEVLEVPHQMEIRGKQADALEIFYNIVMKYHELVDTLNANELVRALAEETGFIAHYRKSDNTEDQERYQNILEFLNGVDGFVAQNPDASLRDYIEEISLLVSLDEWNDEENRITLMTVHASKGLEFPVVFMAGLEDGLFPLYNAMDSLESLEEERRLFYVGLTRAIERAYILFATQRRRMGSDYDVGLVSRFIREIPEENLENISFSSAMTRKIISSGKGQIRVTVKRTVTDFDDFKVGDTVEHAMFGLGIIKALSGAGENQRVGVVFKDGTKKKLIVKYANLKKVDPNFAV